MPRASLCNIDQQSSSRLAIREPKSVFRAVQFFGSRTRRPVVFPTVTLSQMSPELEFKAIEPHLYGQAEIERFHGQPVRPRLKVAAVPFISQAFFLKHPRLSCGCYSAPPRMRAKPARSRRWSFKDLDAISRSKNRFLVRKPKLFSYLNTRYG
jgi:hypothetical protein